MLSVALEPRVGEQTFHSARAAVGDDLLFEMAVAVESCVAKEPEELQVKPIQRPE